MYHPRNYNMFTYPLKKVFSASLVHLNSVLVYTCNTEPDH